MHLFQKTRFLMRSDSENYPNADLLSHHFSSMFMTLSASISASIVSSIFYGKMIQNGVKHIPRIDTSRDLQVLKYHESMGGSHFYFPICLVISDLLLYGKCLNNTNQWTDGTLWFA